MRALLDTNIVLDLLLKRDPDAIVTRDATDYAGASLPVFSPADFLKQLSSTHRA